MADPFERERIAYHESGHAVMGYHLGVPIASVSLVSDLSSFGRCKFESRPRKRLTNRWRENEALLSLAGMAAENLQFGTDDPPCGPDRTVALVMAGALASTEEEANRLVAQLRQTAETILSEPKNWRAVKALALLLTKQDEIPGDEAHEIIKWARSTRPPKQ